MAEPERRQEPPQTNAEQEAALEARALAPAYDYIRAVVTRWRAEKAARERESGHEDQSA